MAGDLPIRLRDWLPAEARAVSRSLLGLAQQTGPSHPRMAIAVAAMAVSAIPPRSSLTITPAPIQTDSELLSAFENVIGNDDAVKKVCGGP